MATARRTVARGTPPPVSVSEVKIRSGESSPHPSTPSPLRWRGGDGKPSPPLHRKGEGVEGWGELSPDLIFTSLTETGGGVPRATVRRAVAILHPRPAVYALEPHSLGAILSDIKT